MARMWAQKWETNGGDTVYSLHINQQDPVVFGLALNRKRAHRDKLNQIGKAYQAHTTPEMFQRVADNTSPPGLIVGYRP